MALRGLVTALQEGPPLRALIGGLFSAQPARSHLLVPPALRPLVVAALWSALGRPLLLLTPGEEEARRWAGDLSALLGEEAPVLPFPSLEVLPYERVTVDRALEHARLSALKALLLGGDSCQRSPPPGPPSRNPDGGKGVPPLVIASAPALLPRTLERDAFASALFRLWPGARTRREDLLRRLADLGYEVVDTVTAPGQVGVRGGIVDLFPPGEALPLRVEFWGDEVESIRRFDPETQRSLGPAEGLTIPPAREVLPAFADGERARSLLPRLDWRDCPPEAGERFREGLERLLAGEAPEEGPFYRGVLLRGSLLDYLPAEGLVVVDEPVRVGSAGQEAEERAESLGRAQERRGDLPRGLPSPLLRWREVEGRLGRLPSLSLETVATGKDGPRLEGEAPPLFWGKGDALASWARRYLRDGGRLLVLSPYASRLADLLRENGVGARLLQDLPDPPVPGSCILVPTPLAEGFVLPLPSGPLAVLTDREVFGRAKVSRPARRAPRRRDLRLPDLVPGTYVVHREHGIGLFRGTARLPSATGEREYLVVEYGEGDVLYVPVEHLDRLAPYRAPGDRPPSLTRLHTGEWARATQRAREGARKLAEELLDLYAAREVLPGFAFSPDTPWQRELEEAFPYLETPDQARAIAEVKEDMERPRPMDRLVCGDVGYGKTEIALRAAFKAVQDGKQVALLCPTTLLAQQHYATFSERLAPFPVRVEVLTRFRTPAEQQEVVEGLRTGAVDIVIGTHRLLQRDIAFRDLGLVIIDDEHRFGVAQKERLKRLRTEVDVLTLTATPIPRTLSLALSGLRDLSLVQTPPEARQPVRTFIAEYSDDLLREALQRELDRGGQAFVVHNRVKALPRWAETVQRLLPGARVGVAHGRMREEDLAEVMDSFIRGRIDILVCTAIIEAGLDIPNANTIVVLRPDLLGLAQMYQLRGRVGRGDRTAFAYFLLPRGVRLTEETVKRLQALLEHQELGSGFQLALRDLEIRGAGNLLGPEQSGHISAVGFDLYCRLLQEAIEDLRARREGLPPPLREPLPSVRVDLPLRALLPEDYIPSLPVRLSLYQRLMEARREEEVEALGEEMRDRFGPLPAEVEDLLFGVRVRVLAERAGLREVVRDGGSLLLRLREPVGGARPALQRALEGIAQVGQEQVRLPFSSRWRGLLLDALSRLASFRAQVLGMVERV